MNNNKTAAQKPAATDDTVSCARCGSSVAKHAHYCFGCGNTVCTDCCETGGHVGPTGRHEAHAAFVGSQAP